MQEITSQEAYKVAARKLARLVDSSEKTACDLYFNGCKMAEYLVKTYNCDVTNVLHSLGRVPSAAINARSLHGFSTNAISISDSILLQLYSVQH